MFLRIPDGDNRKTRTGRRTRTAAGSKHPMRRQQSRKLRVLEVGRPSRSKGLVPLRFADHLNAKEGACQPPPANAAQL